MRKEWFCRICLLVYFWTDPVIKFGSKMCPDCINRYSKEEY